MIATGGPADVRVHFENLTDPRRGEPTYPLLNVVVMTLCAVISGADDFVAIARWSTKNKTWLARYLPRSRKWQNDGGQNDGGQNNKTECQMLFIVLPLIVLPNTSATV